MHLVRDEERLFRECEREVRCLEECLTYNLLRETELEERWDSLE